MLIKMVHFCDKQKLLIQAAELIYTVDKIIATEKVSKLMLYFAKLFEVVTEQRPKYLQGSLFAIGGLLKLEAKSYLKTLQALRSDDEQFELACPLFNEASEMEKMEQQRVRDLSHHDILHFENEMKDVVVEFIRSLVKSSVGVIRNEIWDFYMDFTQEKFIDEIEEEQLKNPERLASLECAHYVICFLFDLIQFIFEHFTTAKEANSKTIDTEMKDPRQIRDHRQPITQSELISHRYQFYFPAMLEIVQVTFEGIKAICPNHLHLLWFWHIKNAEVEKNWADIEDSGDSYDRQDNYNVIGLSTYLFMTAKQAICSLTGTEDCLTEMSYARVQEYYSPVSNDFMFESLMPLISYSLKPRSQTIQKLALEVAGFWTYINQQNGQLYESLGQFTKDDRSVQFMLQQLFIGMGGHKTSEHASRLSMKVIFQVLSMFSDEARIRIITYLVQILDDEKNDRGISVLISQFYKVFCDRGDTKIYLQNAKDELFEVLLNSLKEDQYIINVSIVYFIKKMNEINDS